MTDDLLPPISHLMWHRVATHEAGHAIAYIRAAQAVFGNPHGCRSVHIRPGMSPHWFDDCGRPRSGVGACESSGIFEVGFYRRHRDRGGRLSAEFCAHQRVQADWEIVCSLAGPIAELVDDQTCWPVTDRELIADAGGDGDLEFADKVLEDLKALGRRKPSLKRHMLRALRLVQANADAIEALAERLQIQHHLEFDEVWETVAPHLVREELQQAA